MYKGRYFEVADFSGGYAGNLPATQLSPKQAADLDNVVVKPSGLGIRSRLGDTAVGLASTTIQDLTFTAVAPGYPGTTVSISYADAGDGEPIAVLITGGPLSAESSIGIQFDSGVATATQIKAAYDSTAAVALATCTISGTAGDAQTAPVGDISLSLSSLNSDATIQGIGYYLQADGDDWLLAVAGNKLYQNTSTSGGAWTDITGAVTIDSGANNFWDIFTYGDKVVGFGGLVTSPNPAWTWTGTGNAAALANAPAAYGAFSANNRIFAFRTAAAPSSVFWNIIGDPTDWTGTGSGSAVIGSLNDNQKVTGAVVLSTNYVLVFKENSTYQMVISSAPFPVYSLYDSVGAAGKKAIVNVDGKVYFITSDGEMKATDGETLESFPPFADNLWSSIPSSRYPYIVGFRQKGRDYDWLVWCVTLSGTTNNAAIIWDLSNKCWLQCTTGYKMNAVGQDTFGNVYLGGYLGYVYRPDQTGKYYDDSEASAPLSLDRGTIASYWQSGWTNPESLNKIAQIRKFTAILTPKASGSVTLNYGFDGVANSASTTFSQVATSTEQYLQKSAMISGRGNTFEYKMSLSSYAIDMEVQRLILAGKVYGQKGQAQD